MGANVTMTLKNSVMIVVAATGLLLIGGVVGRGCGETVSEKKQNEILAKQLEALREDHKEVVTVNNKRINNLQELIDSKNAEIGVQADLILKLKDKPTQVKYIIETVTVLQPIDKPTTVSVKDLPPEKLFGFSAPDGGKIISDKMESRDTNSDGIPDQVTFTPYAQTIRLDAALGEKSSTFLLRVKSSYDDKFYDIPVETNVTYVDKDAPERKIIRPDLSMHLGGFVGSDIVTKDLVAGYAAGVSMPWLHPTPAIDLLSPSVSLGSAWNSGTGADTLILRGGASIISYNVGGSGKALLKDIWVGADIGVGTDLSLTGGIVLATRL